MSIPPTLLLADDSLTIQRVVSLTFADQPVRVVVAKDGQDAINRMSTDRPDLILADTNMPCVDGYELARWVRQQPHLSAVPVLLLAGVTEPVDEQRLHDSGANGVLEKPFEPSHVISRVKELLGIKGAPPAAAGRLVTAPDMKTERASRPSRPIVPSAADRPEAAAAPEPSASSSAAAPPDSAADRAVDRATVPAQPRREGLEDRPGDTADVASVVGDAGGPLSGDRVGGAREVSPPEEFGVSDLRFYGQGDDVPVSRGLDVDFAPERPTRHTRSAWDSDGVGSPPGAADVFESLLAAEQGDGSQPVVFRSTASELTPEILDDLATRVVEQLRPTVLRDELQEALGLAIRDAVAHALRESVAAETRAAVAEAVQAAVNGSILGTIRGGVNEAVNAAVPRAVTEAIDSHLSGRVDTAVRESVAGAVPTAVERSLQEFVASRVTVLVRDTIEREMRETVAPALQVVVGEMVAAALQKAVADAVTTAAPTAMFEAVRQEATGQVRQVVIDTSERLVREEIARIRERRA